MLEGECGAVAACSRWSLSYLQRELTTSVAAGINNWHANYSGKGAYVHSKRYQKLAA
ncbi:hypothetical protein OK016_27250 [Vibrio chagasii]|nr:hypothetical protein [Vibrio chagasii]